MLVVLIVLAMLIGVGKQNSSPNNNTGDAYAKAAAEPSPNQGVVTPEERAWIEAARYAPAKK